MLLSWKDESQKWLRQTDLLYFLNFNGNTVLAKSFFSKLQLLDECIWKISPQERYFMIIFILIQAQEDFIFSNVCLLVCAWQGQLTWQVDHTQSSLLLPPPHPIFWRPFCVCRCTHVHMCLSTCVLEDRWWQWEVFLFMPMGSQPLMGDRGWRGCYLKGFLLIRIPPLGLAVGLLPLSTNHSSTQHC